MTGTDCLCYKAFVTEKTAAILIASQSMQTLHQGVCRLHASRTIRVVAKLTTMTADVSVASSASKVTIDAR